MSKPWKIALWVGVPVLVILVTISVIVSVREKFLVGDRDYSNDGMYETFGIAMKEQAVGSAASMPSPSMAPRYDSMKRAEEQNAVASDLVPSKPVDRLIIKTGNLSMVVENVRAQVKAIADYAVQKGGFVVTSNVSKSGLALLGNITVRIPSDVFDKGLEDVKALGEVTSEEVNGQDVTEEYTDLDSQLRNLNATETQLLEIMRRAVKIEDVLAVQQQLTEVRGRIESIQGRMKYLKESARLSTLTIYLSTDPSVLPSVNTEDQWKPWASAKNAFRQLVDLGKGIVDVVIWLVVYIPLWAVLAFVVWVVVRMVRRRLNRNSR